MKSNKKKWLLVVLAIYVGAGLSVGAYQGVSNLVDAAAVTKVHEEAKKWALPQTSVRDASHWLEEHGFNVEDGWRQVGENDETKCLVVKGRRELRAGSFLLKPSQLVVDFRFAEDGKLLEVEATRWPFPLESRRSGK